MDFSDKWGRDDSNLIYNHHCPDDDFCDLKIAVIFSLWFKFSNNKLQIPISFIIFTYMNADLIKNELLEWLAKLEDKSLLTSLLQFKKSAEAGDWADNLTNEQLESLQQGLADYKTGDVISSKDFWSASLSGL